MFNRRLTSLRSMLGLFLAALQALPAAAGTVRFTQGGTNARKSFDFRRHANVLTTVSAGTTGVILERWELPSGNYGIKLKISALGSGGTTLKVGEEIWVYYHRDSDLRRIELFDDAGTRVNDAGKGRWASALSSFRTQRSAAPLAAQVCVECRESASLQASVQPLPTVKVEAAAEIAESTSDAPIVDVGTEEVITYIGAHVSAKYRKRHARAIRRAAETMIAECERWNVPLELALGLMQGESGLLVEGDDSPKGAKGPMQVMPDTYLDGTGHSDLTLTRAHRKMLKKHPERAERFMARRAAALANIAEPETNIKFGVKMLAKLLKRYGGNEAMAIAAYNAGPGRVNAYLRGTRALPAETRNHIAKVARCKRNYLAYVKASRTKLIASL